MSQPNNPILPTLSDYSILMDEELASEIYVCKLVIEMHKNHPNYIYQYSQEEYQNRLMLAEQELERRYLLS